MFGFSDGGMDDIFSAFFSGGPGGRPRGGRGRRADRAPLALPVTLADLYGGKTVAIARPRAVPCAACAGSGSRRKRSAACAACRGSGAREAVQQMGMMMQRVRTVCNACGGSGKRIDPKDVCKTCGGAKVETVEHPLTVHVERGMQHHEELLLRSEGDFNTETGRYSDVLIVLDQAEDSQFVREGDDLIMTRHITLAEALCGFQFSFKHLDGREIIVRRERGEITNPGETKMVIGEGMPARRDPRRLGDLIIKFVVKFPERMQDSQVEILRGVLPPPKPVNMEDMQYAEECYVSREELDRLRKELEETVEEDDSGSPNIACSSQ